MKIKLLTMIVIALLLFGAITYAQDDEGFAEVRERLKQGLEEKAQVLRDACLENPYSDSCGCDNVLQSSRPACEAAVAEGLKMVMERREIVEEQCGFTLELCQCSRVPFKYRSDCELEKGIEVDFFETNEDRCQRSPAACNCDMYRDDVKECRKMKREAVDEEIGTLFASCFQNITGCDCGALFTDDDLSSFCEEQRRFSLNCIHSGLDCDRIDDTKVIPGSLQGLFRESMRDKAEEAQQEDMNQAWVTITLCIDSPSECDCSSAPMHIQEFCEHKRVLQVKCDNGDDASCAILEDEAVLPDYLPEYNPSVMFHLVEMFKGILKWAHLI